MVALNRVVRVLLALATGLTATAARAQGMLDGVPDTPGVQRVAPPAAPPQVPTPAGPAQPPLSITPPAAPVSPPPAQPGAAPAPAVAGPAAPPAAQLPDPTAPPAPFAGPPAATTQVPAAPPAPPAQAPAAPPAPPAQAPGGAPQTAQPRSMLEGIDPKDGVLTVIPPSGPPAAPQPSTATPAPSPVAAPRAASTPAAILLTDVVRSVIAAGVPMTPPPAGPVAAALDDIAKQCQRPIADVQQALGTLSRPTTLTKLLISSHDNREKGAVFAVSIEPATKLPDAFSCVTARPPAALKLDLLVRARDFGPMDGPRLENAKPAPLTRDLNAAFGDPANPWRLATADELFAIVPVLLEENLWGPDEGLFWTAHALAGGGGLAIETRRDSTKQGYRAILILGDMSLKATPIWVRNGK
jgi:hypothetical protein